MKQKFVNLGLILSKEKAKKLIGATGGFEDGGQCWSTCENEFNTYCLNNIYSMVPGEEGHSQESDYYTKCLGVQHAQAFCLKKCSSPTQPASR